LRLHGFADFANYQLPEIGSISIITNQRLWLQQCNQSRIARFAISPPPRETRCGRSSTAYWTRSPFRKVVAWNRLGNDGEKEFGPVMSNTEQSAYKSTW